MAHAILDTGFRRHDSKETNDLCNELLGHAPDISETGLQRQESPESLRGFLENSKCQIDG